MEPPAQTPSVKQILGCLLAGASLTLAFAPYNLFFLAVLSPAVLFYCWHKASPGNALILGYAFGFGLFGTGMHWLHISINLFGGVNTFGAYCFTYLLVAYLSIYPALAGYISRRWVNSRDPVNLLVVVPASWTLMEWCRAWVLTGLPWLNLGYSQTDTTLAAVAPVTGVFGISWLVAVSAGLLVLFFQSTPGQKPVYALVFGLVLATPMTLTAIQWTRPTTEQRTVALVQGAIPQAIKWQPEQRQNTINLYARLSAAYWEHDLIIWPETAIPLFINEASFLIDALQEKSDHTHADILTGIPERDRDASRYYNTILTIGNSQALYRKRHLVPFGEYLPFDGLLRPLLDITGIQVSNFSAGDNRPLVHVAGVPTGVSICFEDAFGEEIIDALPEAQLLVNISNDAWFGDSLAPHQHLQMARMRAMETGRYLLRATNTGISAIIDEKGNLIARSKQFQPDVINARVQLMTGATPYSRFGNLPVIYLLLLIMGVIVVRAETDRKNPA